MPPMQPITALVREGMVNRDTEIAVPWWSYAKTVLASAALALVAQGRLQLDKPVDGKPFTLRQLLQHRSGLRCYGALPTYHFDVAAGSSPWSADEMLGRADAGTLAYRPGRGWAYSNIGYLMVRNLVERESALPLGPALDRLAFEPLGISGVRVAQLPADLDPTAWGNARRYHPGWVCLLVGPPHAAALFLHRLLAGELLPPDLLDIMREPHLISDAFPGRPWRTANYGLGLMIGQGEPQGEYVGHTGGGPGSTSAVYQLVEGPLGAPARSTAAAFAPIDDPGMVEARCMELAFHDAALAAC